MALSLQQIQAANNALGIPNTPQTTSVTPPSTAVQQTQDRRTQLAQQALQNPPQPSQSTQTPSLLDKLNSNPVTGTINDVGTGLAKSAIGTVAGVANIGKNIGNAMSNIPGLGYLKTNEQGGAAQSIKNLQATAQPSNTGETVGKIGGDIAQFFIPGGAEADATGAINKAVDTAKFAEQFGPKAGEALSGILKVLGHSAVGATSAGAVTAAQTGGDPTATAAGAVAGGLAAPIGNVLKSAGEGVAKMFIPKSDAEAGLLQAYKASTPLLERVKNVLDIGSGKAPSTAASAAFDKGIMGTESSMGVQAKKAQTKLWSGLIKPALEQSDTKVNIPDFLNQAEQKITSETNDPTRLGILKNALNSIKEDFAGVKDISLAQLQKYKEGWAEFVPEKAYKGQPIAGALNDVRNTLAGMSRQTIYNSLGDNVKQAYIDYGNLHGISALGRKAMTGAIKGGTGTTLKNIMEAATVPIGTIGGQTIYKVGQGIELLGKAGASTVKDLLGTASGSGDTSTSE